MSKYLNNMLATLNNDTKKGREALSSNNAKSTYSKSMLSTLENDVQQAKNRSTLNMTPYRAPAVNTKFQQTYQTLENARKKYGNTADTYSDALRLTNYYGQTVRDSFDLHGGQDNVDYLKIAQKSYDDELNKTLMGYQYSTYTPEQMKQTLEGMGYQSPKTIEEKNQSRVIEKAKQQGLSMLTPEEEKQAQLYEEAARYGGGMGKIVNGITGIQEEELTGMGQDAVNPYRLDAQTREKYGKEAEALRAKSQITYDAADAYLRNNPAYSFAKDHPGDVNGYADQFEKIGDIANKAKEKGVDSLTDQEQEIYYYAMGQMNDLEDINSGKLANWGTKYADALRDVNGLYSAYQPTEQQEYLLGMYRDTMDGAKEYLEEAKGTNEEKQAEDNYYFVSEREKFAEYERRPDFDANTPINKEHLNDPVYAAVSGQKSTSILGALGNTIYQGTQDTAYMTPEERGKYRWYYDNVDPKTAQEYYGYLSYELAERRKGLMEAGTRAAVQSSPGNAAALEAFSVLENQAAGLLGAGDLYGQMLARQMGTLRAPINYNTKAQDLYNQSNTIRATNTEQIQKTMQDAGASDWLIDTVTTIKNGMEGAADSVVGGYVGSFFGVSEDGAKLLTNLIVSSRSAQDAMQNIHDRGGSDEQAAIGGIASGVAEWFFEQYSIEQMFSDAKKLGKQGFRDWVNSAIKEGLVNAQQEGFTSIADSIADVFIMGDKSDFVKAKNEYERLGFDPNKAEKKAIEDIAAKAGQEAIGGLVMGEFVAAGTNIASSATTRSTDKQTGSLIKPETRLSIWKVAEELGGEAAKAAGKYDSAKATNKQTGEVVRETFKQLSGQHRNILIDRMAVDLQDADISRDAAKSISLMMAGQELGPEEIQSLARDEKAMDVLYEAMGVKEAEEKPAGSGPEISAVKPGENINTEAMGTEERLNISPMPGIAPAEEETRPDHPMLDKENQMAALDGEAAPRQADAEAAQKKPALQQPIAFEAGAQDSTAEAGTRERTQVRVTGISRDQSSGAVEVTLEDGRRVALEDAGFSEEAQVLAAEAADLPQDAQRVMAEGYGKGQDAKTYTRGFKAVFNMAALGEDSRTVRSLYGDELTQEQRDAAADAGKAEFERTQALAAANTRKTQMEMRRQGLSFKLLEDGDQGGGVYLARVEKDPSNINKAQLIAADRLAKEYGFQVRVFDEMNENGSYEAGSNIINVALNAEESMVGRTVSHELFHYIKEWSEDAGTKLQGYILDALKKAKGYDYEGRISQITEQYHTQAGQQLTREMAEEEMAAEGMLDVIGTEENLQNLVKETKDKGLIEKIRDWLQNTITKIKDAMDRLAWNHPEVRALKDDVNYLNGRLDLVKEALRQARENYRTAYQGLYDAAARDADVQAYTEAMESAVTQEDAQAEAEALVSRLYTRAEKNWIAQHQDQFEQGFDAFRRALDEYTRGEKTLPKAFTDAGLDAPAQSLFPVLAYAGRQMESARKQVEQENKLRQAQNIPTGYFEAKPQRAVDFSEVMRAVVPESMSQGMRQRLLDAGVGEVVTYPDGDQEARKEAMNGRPDLMFSQRAEKEDYDYETLVSKPDMKITQLQDISDEEFNQIISNRKKAASQLRKELAQKDKPNITSRYKNNDLLEVYVYNPDTKRNIMISKDTYLHNARDIYSKLGIQVFKELDSILENAIAVNELEGRTEFKIEKAKKGQNVVNKSRESNYGIVLIGMAETDNEYIPVRFKVDNRTWETTEYDILAAINKNSINKRGSSLAAPRVPGKPDFGSSSMLSIAEILDMVKNVRTISDVLSLDAAEKLGYERGNDPVLGGSLLFSTRADSDDRQEQEALDAVAEDPELYAQVKNDADTMAAWQLLRRLHRLTTAGGENALIQKGAFEKRLSQIVQGIEEKTGTKYGPIKLRNALRKIYGAMEQSEYSAGEILQYTREIMKQVLDASPGVLLEQDETTKDILSELKNRRFYLNDDQKSEIKNQYGTISRYTQKNFGTLHIVKRDGKTASLEDVWMEDLSPRLPGVFSADTSPLDMPGILDAWLEGTKEKKYAGEFGNNIGAYATDLALNAMLNFYDVPGALKTKQNIREEYREQLGQQAERIRDLTATARNAVNSAREEYAEKYRQRIEKAQERRQETERKQQLRKKITRDVRAINSLNVKQNDLNHVPEEMRAAALEAVRPFLAGSGVFTNGEMIRLSNTYNLLRERAGEIGGFDEDILATINGLSDRLNGRRLSELTEAEMQDISDIMGNMRKMIADANEVFVNKRKTTVEALSNQLKEDMQNKKQVNTSKLAAMARSLQMRESTPVYFADRVGGVVRDMINDFFAGQDTWAFTMDKAKKYMKEQMEKYHVKDWIDDAKHARFVTQHGDQIELDKEEAMSLYALWKRETSNKLQNANHLRVGGFMYQKGKKYEGVDTLRPHPLTSSDMKMIESYLTDEQKSFADEMVKYLSVDMSKIGNEVSMRLYGYEKFKEPYYFPYETDHRYLVGDLTQTGEAVKQPKSAGMTKALMQNAATPITVGDFTTTWAKHINQMGLYAGFAESVDTMSRVLNHREAGEVMLDSVTGEEYVVSPQSNWIELERAIGAEGVQYLKTLVRDISGGVRADERGPIAKGLSMFKKASVAGNLSVVLQQPTAYARAMLMVSPQYLLSSNPVRLAQDIRNMYQYSGVALIKQMGKFDTGTGKGAIAWMTEDVHKGNIGEQALGWVDKFAGIGAEKADEWTWGLLWGAVERETKNNRADLKTGTEEFYKAVAKRFEDVVNHTQVYDSVLSRSEWMRSNTTMDKMVTSFMAEPTLSLNMLMDAITSGESAGRGKRIAKAAATYTVSSLLVALAKSIATASRRKKDEGRTWLVKYVAESAGNFLDEMSPFGLISMIPWARDVLSIFEGYDVERSDMDAVTQVKKGFDTLTKYLKGGDISLEDTLQGTLGPVANLFGIPLKNLWRDTEAVTRNLFGGASANEPTTGRDVKYSVLENLQMGPISLWDSSNKAYYDRMEQALIAGDMDKYNELRGYLEETKQVKPSTVTSGLKTEIKGSLLGGLISDDKAIKLLEDHMGMDHDEAWELAEKWTQEAAHEDDEDYIYTKYGELIDLVKEGKDITQAEKKLTDNAGVEDKDIRSTIKSKIGGWYKSGEITSSQAAQKLKQYAKITDANDLYWIMDEWDYMKANPTGTYKKYAALDTAIENGRNIRKETQRYLDHGVEKDTIATQITKDFKQKYLDLLNRNPTKAASLKAWILDAYEALGYDRSKKQKDIDKWKTQTK